MTKARVVVSLTLNVPAKSMWICLREKSEQVVCTYYEGEREIETATLPVKSCQMSIKVAQK